MDSQNIINFIKNDTWLKGYIKKDSYIKKLSFKNTSSYETGFNDHHLVYSVMKTIF